MVALLVNGGTTNNQQKTKHWLMLVSLVSRALAAATFTDTFALGDNTKINLNSDGSADSGEQ